MKLLIKAFLFVFILSLLTFLVSHFSEEPPRNLSVASRKEISMPTTSKPILMQEVYEFIDKDLALRVLNRLDVFQQLENFIFIRTNGTKIKYNKPFLGLKLDDDYCEKHRSFLVNNTHSIFTDINYFVEEGLKSFLRSKVFAPIGNDIHPELAMTMPMTKQKTYLYSLDPKVNIFFTKNNQDIHMIVGKHFSCLTQEYNHIPGHDYLSSKDLVAEAVTSYAKRYENRPHCFSYKKFFPETWVLYNKEQCEEFFENLNSETYKIIKEERKIIYIRKNANASSHRGEGVQPVNEEEEAELRNLYDNGRSCGEIKKNYIVQHFIHNPLLLNGHKFDFRMYMLIASTNPLMAYYHDGFLRVTLASYDVSSDEKKVLLTNLALNKQIYDDVKKGNLYEGKDEETLKLDQQWSFNRLQDYLLEKKIITDQNWLDNYLRPEFKKAMIHLIRVASDNFLRRSSLYELYGVDFMLDENLNLWFIESNSGPAFKGYSQPMEKFILKMLNDHLEIVTGLLRSRTKRIVLYVNKLIQDKSAQKGTLGRAWLDNVELRKQEFQNITKNSFEEEFIPQETNGFAKIIDENYTGLEKYLGLIQKECL